MPTEQVSLHKSRTNNKSLSFAISQSDKTGGALFSHGDKSRRPPTSRLAVARLNADIDQASLLTASAPSGARPAPATLTRGHAL